MPRRVDRTRRVSQAEQPSITDGLPDTAHAPLPSLYAPSGIQVVVGSGGGVGTTFLIEFLARYLSVNDPHDRDGLKHLRLPPLSFDSSLRFVFVHGDPRAAVVSLFRRRFHSAQAAKLQRFAAAPRCPIPYGMSLEEYVAQGRDCFAFEAQFDNWYARCLHHPTLFLRYETIWDNLPALARFLALPDTLMAEFPARRERNQREQAAPVRAGLDALYGCFAARLEALPDAVIRMPARGRLRGVAVSAGCYGWPLLDEYLFDRQGRRRAALARQMPWLRRGYRRLRGWLADAGDRG